MPTTCDAAEYISQNAEGGKTNSQTCKRVLSNAWSLTRHFRKHYSKNTTDEYLYLEYVDGQEDDPERTRWLVKWLFNQDSFPNELPSSWGVNPIINNELNIPDAMIGLKQAADDFIAKNCFAEETS